MKVFPDAPEPPFRGMGCERAQDSEGRLTNRCTVCQKMGSVCTWTGDWDLYNNKDLLAAIKPWDHHPEAGLKQIEKPDIKTVG